MATLFQISDDLRAVIDLVDDSAELPPIVEQWFAEIGEAESEKLFGYWSVMRQLEMEAATATAEAEQFQAKARARENAVKRMKDRLKLYLELTGRREAVASNGKKFAIQANGGKQAVTQTYALNPQDMTAEEVGRCPEALLRPRVALDMDELRKGLESGERYDLAKLEPRGTHLRVR